jgi:flagellar protein FliL
MPEEKEPSDSRKKIVLVMVAAVVLVMGIMAAGVFVLWVKITAVGSRDVKAAKGRTVQKAPAALPGKTVRATVRPVYTLDPFIVPLAGRDRKRFLRVTFALEMSSITHRPILEKHSPRIRDTISHILPTRTYADIATAQGKQALRDEILTGLHAFMPASAVTDLYLTEFVLE